MVGYLNRKIFRNPPGMTRIRRCLYKHVLNRPFRFRRCADTSLNVSILCIVPISSHFWLPSTVDGSEFPNNHLIFFKIKLWNNWDKLPTSTGFLAGFLPTVWQTNKNTSSSYWLPGQIVTVHRSLANTPKALHVSCGKKPQKPASMGTHFTFIFRGYI